MNFKNEKRITKIEFEKRANLFCPLGQDFYFAKIRVVIKPKEILMDYLDIEKFFSDLQGRELIIEDAVSEVFDFIDRNFNPNELVVSIDAESNVHFPVHVEKEK